MKNDRSKAAAVRHAEPLSKVPSSERRLTASEVEASPVGNDAANVNWEADLRGANAAAVRSIEEAIVALAVTGSHESLDAFRPNTGHLWTFGRRTAVRGGSLAVGRVSPHGGLESGRVLPEQALGARRV